MELARALKIETKPDHDELEAELNLLRPELTLTDYVDLLKRFYGFYAPFEKKLQEKPLPVPFEGRLKTEVLKRDLLELGVSSEEIDELPKLPAMSLTRPEEILGALYVLEGSTLGGLVLQGHFGKKFGLSPSHGLSYFSGYGAETMPRWREFQNLLEESLQVHKLEQNVIISSAQATFRTLKGWLTS